MLRTPQALSYKSLYCHYAPNHLCAREVGRTILDHPHTCGFGSVRTHLIVVSDRLWPGMTTCAWVPHHCFTAQYRKSVRQCVGSDRRWYVNLAVGKKDYPLLLHENMAPPTFDPFPRKQRGHKNAYLSLLKLQLSMQPSNCQERRDFVTQVLYVQQYSLTPRAIEESAAKLSRV